MSTSALRIVWVYPDLLSTYGDRGNMLIMRRRARLRGIATECHLVASNAVLPRSADIYLIGGGEDRPQRLAGQRLLADAGLAAAVAGGAAVLGVCAGYQLLGESYADTAGAILPGLGLLDVHSHRAASRAIGEIVVEPDPTLDVPRLTGFENHAGATTLGPGARPLGTTLVGVGNGGVERTEGAWSQRIIGSYLHGPMLVRNPAVADRLLEWVVGPIGDLGDPLVDRLRAERFEAVLPAARWPRFGAPVATWPARALLSRREARAPAG